MAGMDTNAALAKMAYERQMASVSGAGGASGLDAVGPPYWDRQSWEAWHAQYGEWPFGMQSDGSVVYPPSFENCPDWAYQLMGLRKPPVQVNNQNMASAPTPADRATVWGVK